jgi:hypothetical protein
MKTTTCTVALAWIGLALCAPPASGHSELGTPLKKKYELRSVYCTACHDKDEKDKSIEHLTPFGKDIARILEGKKFTERIEAAKELERDEKKKVLEEIEKEYIEALKKLDETKTADGKLYKDVLPAGDIEGTRPR